MTTDHYPKLYYDIALIIALAQAAEKEGGFNNIHMLGYKKRKKRCWHRCVQKGTGNESFFLYNDNTNDTRSIRIV